MAIYTVEQIKEVIGATTVSDDRLQDLLDAAEQDILGVAGATDELTEYAPGGYSTVALRRPVGVVDTVSEYADTTNETDVAADDYRVDGYLLHRLTTGTNPRSWWAGPVKVVHDPADRLAERKRAQAALISLDLTEVQSGYLSESTLDESRTRFPNGESTDQRRVRILDSLRPVMVK